ncbi:hypothetical protein OSB04_016159 [Centaurea solstitialis]|uniref:Peptidase C14 caspase domain-containing protein n=1 Tax=Centaurea solstitialis TaxID=347529 RepID=A0AA38T208_9ASTR|nr:hypothetical protein OSB04_016159 [Centaurea solstitialis]
MSPSNTVADFGLVLPENQHICCPECRDVVSDDGETPIEELSRDRCKLVRGSNGLNTRLKKMSRRRELSDLNHLSSYEKFAIESIRNWEPMKGKRALLCGLTYYKQKYSLKGPDYDVSSMRELLMSRFLFPSSSIRILSEVDQHLLPTKRNIQEALRWLVKDNQDGDSLVFYFSGHGFRLPDFFDDELDGFNEMICPLDYTTAGVIIDNEINDTIVRPLRKGVKLHVIVDACHSGTILDLSHVYNTKMSKWLDNSPPSGVYKGTSGGHAISISACEDHQFALESSVRKQMEGVMTYTFRKAIAENRRVTYAGLLASMHNDMLEVKAKCSRLCNFFRSERLQVWLGFHLLSPDLSSSIC